MLRSIDRYAVVGNPIAHSRSPEIHAQFARQTGQAIQYDRIRLQPATFHTDVLAFFREGGKGLNVTVPFKENAWQLAASLSDRAQLAGAVNTLCQNADGSLHGDNTDGAGLVSDMLAGGWSLQGKRLLVLGAGGAVRGVLQPLLAQRPAALTVANRTVEKAQALHTHFKSLGPINACAYDGLAGKSFDLIINGTSASLSGSLPPLPDGILNPGACAYDMMYSAQPTIFLQWAQQSGAAQCRDGLGMLVGQAAESFYLWRGVRPDVQPVVDWMRTRMMD